MLTRELIIEAARRSGLDETAIERLLAELSASQSLTLTIICNDGVHPIPKEHLPGQVFSATNGNIADGTPDVLEQTVADACRRLVRLIKDEGPFSEIYIIPSGYAVLLQKLAETVFQITGQPATTLHFDRRTKAYWPIRLDLRSIIADG